MAGEGGRSFDRTPVYRRATARRMRGARLKARFRGRALARQTPHRCPLPLAGEGRGEGFCKRLTMLAESVFFWIFATVLVGSALAVISARNPVHSVLFLILAFVNAAGLFLLMGAEFLAMILVVVYVGAVAVLFLFIVMLVYVESRWAIAPDRAGPATPSGTLSNTAALGEVLYTRYFYFFQAAGMILLTAMIGAIVLTLHHKAGVKRQDVGAQVARDPETAVELRKVPSRAGI